MARRKRAEPHENHERWLVSYADFITLLFAFFVVMYSTSSVNEGKYRVLSDSIIAAFSGPTRSMEPVQVGQLVRSTKVQGLSPARSMFELDLPGKGIGDGGPGFNESEKPTPETAVQDGAAPEGPDEPVEQPEKPADPQSVDAPMAELAKIAGKMEGSLASLIDQDLIEVRSKGDWLEVEMKTSILFSSGSARLTPEAIPLLENLARILGEFPNPIQVEGFTDNVPIHTVAFPSNWELSAARAASVVHLFTKYNVRPDRMLAIGYGEYRPVADNGSAEGRSKNRRVVIVIPASGKTRRFMDLYRMSGESGHADVSGPPPPMVQPKPTGG